MPSITGPIKINAVSGVFNVGDTLNIAPKDTSKTYAGSGSFSTGDFLQTNNGFSSTNTLDPDVSDSSNYSGN